MNTRTLALGGRFTHLAQAPTTTLLLIEHRQDTPGVETLTSGWTTSAGMGLSPFTDLYGNRGQRLVLPEGESVVEYSALVRVPDAVDEADPDAPELSPDDLPGEVITYLFPSRYCQSDLLAGEAWDLFGHLPQGRSRVEAISTHVHQHVEYRTGSTTSTYTALDAFQNGYGICRDLTHLFVTFCRALNIPARFVSGYLPDMDVEVLPTPMDFHAWAEVYLGDRWWTFDPRHDARRKGHVPIARGRDAVDVALTTTFGAPRLTSMVVTCHEVPDPAA